MVARNVIKSLAVAEDLLHGVGQVQQLRKGSLYDVHRIDIPLGLSNESELFSLDPVRFPRARYGNTEFEYISGAWQERLVVAPYPLIAGLRLTAQYNQVIKEGIIARYTGTLPYVTTGVEDITAAPWEVIGGGGSLASSVNVLNLKALPSAAAARSNVTYHVTGFYSDPVTVSSQFVWFSGVSKTLHNGVTIYAPEAIAAWNGSQASLATLHNWTGTGNGVYVRLNSAVITPEMAGAVGAPGINDTVALVKALSVASAAKVCLNGNGKWYEVSGDITFPAWTWVEELKLKQLLPNTVFRRTIYQNNGTYCYLHKVVVNRNGTGTGGSLSDAAGIWITNCAKAILREVEVFGNDFGSGIALIDCNDAEIDSPYVHDIVGGSAAFPTITDDTIHGVWIQRGTGARITNPRVKNLSNLWSGQATINRFSRGIAVGGAKRFAISNPMVDNVDQGIDITGGENPEFFTITGGIIANCNTWGVKCANSVQNGQIVGVLAYRCGMAGFVSSAPSDALSDLTQRITYTGCRAVQTGFGGAWTGTTSVAGFRTSNTGLYIDYPRSIKYIGCSADGIGGVMEYGFFNEAVLGTLDGEQWIEATDCDVRGATIGNYYNLNIGYAQRIKSSPQSIPDSAWTDLTFDTEVDYMGGLFAPTPNTTINATRSGLWDVYASVSWEGRSGGTRFIRISVDGAIVPGSVMRIAPGSANELNMPPMTIPLIIPVAGAAIKLQVGHDSGTPLNVLGGSTLRLVLNKSGYGG